METVGSFNNFNNFYHFNILCTNAYYLYPDFEKPN